MKKIPNSIDGSKKRKAEIDLGFNKVQVVGNLHKRLIGVYLTGKRKTEVITLYMYIYNLY